MISFVLAAMAAVQPVQAGAPALPRAAVKERAAVGAQVQALFARTDANRDGFLTREEAQAGRALHKQERRRRGARAERGRDLGHADLERGPMAAFDRMDANRDGAISRAEFAQASERRAEQRFAQRRGGGRGMGLGGRMFELADANRDGRVSLQEATVAAYQRFDMADLNRDGRLTREERIQHRQQRAAAPPRG